MNIYVLGEDERSNYLRKIYKEDLSSIEKSDIIFCPIPFSRDNVKINNSNMLIEDLIKLNNIEEKVIISGSISTAVKEKLNEKNIKVIDIMDEESFAIKNAIATSEGAIKKVIEMTPFTLNKSNILILGYGRIGKILSHYLSSFGAKLYVEARSKKDIALIKSMGYNGVELEKLDKFLPDMQFIFNTIPSVIIDKEKVKLLDSNVYVIDIASKPGVDFEALNERGIATSWYLQIPSKDSPKSAAMYIRETVDENIRGM